MDWKSLLLSVHTVAIVDCIPWRYHSNGDDVWTSDGSSREQTATIRTTRYDVSLHIRTTVYLRLGTMQKYVIHLVEKVGASVTRWKDIELFPGTIV